MFGLVRSSRVQAPRQAARGEIGLDNAGYEGWNFGLVMALSCPVGLNAPPRTLTRPCSLGLSMLGVQWVRCAAGITPCVCKGVGVVLHFVFGSCMGRGDFYALVKIFYVCSENVYPFAQKWNRHINLL